MIAPTNITTVTALLMHSCKQASICFFYPHRFSERVIIICNGCAGRQFLSRTHLLTYIAYYIMQEAAHYLTDAGKKTKLNKNKLKETYKNVSTNKKYLKWKTDERKLDRWKKINRKIKVIILLQPFMIPSVIYTHDYCNLFLFGAAHIFIQHTLCITAPVGFLMQQRCTY